MALRIVMTFGGEGELHPEMVRDGRALNGIRTAILALCSALAQRGHDVHLFARCSRAERQAGVAWHDRAEFAGFAQVEAVDVLVAVPPVLPLLMPLHARARVVWSGNAFRAGDCMLCVPYPWAPELGRAGQTARLYSPRVWQPYADRIVVKSQWQAAYMRDTLAIPGETFTVAYNGVPLQHYQGPAPLRHRRRLVYASEARRGLDVLLGLFPRIRTVVPEAEVHIFGYEYGSTEGLPALPGAHQPNVIWHGRVDKKTLADELRAAGVMAYPCTLKETFCTAVAEAQAAGLPVVTSDRAALAERVTPGVDGFLIAGHPADPAYQSAFIDAVLQLLHNDELWTCMSTEATRKAQQAYDWEAIAAAWEDDLTRLVAGRAPLPPRHDGTLDLCDPSLLRISDRGVSAQIPGELAAQWLQEAWAAYGYDLGAIPGLRAA